MLTPDEAEVLEVLSKGRVFEVEELTAHGMARTVALDALESLHRRRLVSIENPLYGDNRLLSARGVSLSFDGAEALREEFGRAGMSETRDPEHSGLTVREKRERRAAFMGQLYELTGGSKLKRVNFRQIGAHFGWEEDATYEVAQYLVDEYLAEWAALGGSISITHSGVVEVEAWLESPDEPTEHFAPVAQVTVHVHGDNHGQIQAGSPGSTQTMNVGVEASLILDFVNELRAALSTGAHGDPALAEASLTIIEGELERGEAKSPLIRRLLPPLRDLALGIVGSGAYEGLHAAVTALPPF